MNGTQLALEGTVYLLKSEKANTGLKANRIRILELGVSVLTDTEQKELVEWMLQKLEPRLNLIKFHGNQT